ncbi:hypothetical protein HMPREF9441_02734 [Paraprevotella clara YIT 11840]|uniref:Uncharacterized protein n=1 Tax=Paraprevotella clara YIT 11840 TaxID=762968 RepID=G5STM9_9BACT|nr:hypothetical protein HMPREF9441_02734 [Paraprevotella clara YIT 11840]
MEEKMFRKSLIMSFGFLCGELKIVWLRTKNRLAENDFLFGDGVVIH